MRSFHRACLLFMHEDIFFTHICVYWANPACLTFASPASIPKLLMACSRQGCHLDQQLERSGLIALTLLRHSCVFAQSLLSHFYHFGDHSLSSIVIRIRLVCCDLICKVSLYHVPSNNLARPTVTAAIWAAITKQLVG